MIFSLSQKLLCRHHYTRVINHQRLNPFIRNFYSHVGIALCGKFARGEMNNTPSGWRCKLEDRRKVITGGTSYTEMKTENDEGETFLSI
ncbi:hypothetical protein E2C01_074527 [Portunus trituberculatus]|uniref:Uncharacterized protein n=1 Tax=Portunus trituberculatus TaxID=210409 RepID=A0A5B7IEI7_PORTR|nr:hypothetical protein [Portunus trituberculatus]